MAWAARSACGAYLAKVAAARPAINVGAFIGHGAVREAVVGQANRVATPEELERMRELVRTGMREGAVRAEHGPLLRSRQLRAARRGGGAGARRRRVRRHPPVTHARRGRRVLDSVRDTIAIGERGGLPTQVTHHKIIGKANWGRSVDTLRLIDEARARGVDATIDQYPYTAFEHVDPGRAGAAVGTGRRPREMLKGLRDETDARQGAGRGRDGDRE